MGNQGCSLFEIMLLAGMDTFDGWAVIPRGWAMTAVRCLIERLNSGLAAAAVASSAARAAQPRGLLSISTRSVLPSVAVRCVLIWQNAIGLMAHAIAFHTLGLLRRLDWESWRSWPTLLHAQPWMGVAGSRSFTGPCEPSMSAFFPSRPGTLHQDEMLVR
jgi:hypothetical protein